MRKPVATVLLRDHRTAFRLVPKAGATTIRFAAKRIGGVETTGPIPDGYRVIGVVRNSWERLVSCWHQKLHTTKQRAGQLGTPFRFGMGFDAFLELVQGSVEANHHFAPQGQFVTGATDIWHLPDLTRRWLEAFGAEPALENQGPSRLPWRDYYQAGTRAAVATLYAGEIQRFGFTFDG